MVFISIVKIMLQHDYKLRWEPREYGGKFSVLISALSVDVNVCSLPFIGLLLFQVLKCCM